MIVRRVVAGAVATLVCAIAVAGGTPSPPIDPLIASFVPVGGVNSVTPIAPAFQAPGVIASSATQSLAGVSDWFNIDIWPVQMPNGFNPGRYIEIGLATLPDRVARVTHFRYASQSYADSFGVLQIATDADGFATSLGSATSPGPGVRVVELSIVPSADIDLGALPRFVRLYPFQTTPVLDWLDLVAANGGLRIHGRIALVRTLGVGQERYSFTADQLGGAELPAAITHVQFLVAGPAVVLAPFAATAPRTACLSGTALLAIASPPDPATITGIGAPCGPLDPLAGATTTLWKLSDGRIYGMQVTRVVPQLEFRVRRLDDGVFGNGFE